MFISKYVKEVQYDSENLILHNRFNGAIYFISCDDYKKIQNGETNNSHYDVLLEEKFLVDKENIPKQIRENKFISITIEVSNSCNLDCVYCYENDKGTRGCISNEIISYILVYLENVMQLSNADLGIRFIGGETLLAKDKVIYLMDNIDRISTLYGRKVNYIIDTNGTIPFEDIYSIYDNLRIAIALTSKEDHNLMRKSDIFDSYETIIRNLKNVKPKETNSIEIRYNTNEINITQFRSFVEMVKKELPICSAIKPMYTDEYPHKAFRNKLSLDEFVKWNSTEAVDILVSNDFPVAINIGGQLTICEAYQNYSCKIYLDGIITLCDSMFHDKGYINIAEVYDNPEKLEKAFQLYRSYDPMKDKQCSECLSVAQCSGKLFCRSKFCDYNKRYDNDLFLKKYVYYTLNGKGKYFSYLQ